MQQRLSPSKALSSRLHSRAPQMCLCAAVQHLFPTFVVDGAPSMFYIQFNIEFSTYFSIRAIQGLIMQHLQTQLPVLLSFNAIKTCHCMRIQIAYGDTFFRYFSHVILIGPRCIKCNARALKIAMFSLCVEGNLQDQSARVNIAKAASLFVAQDMKRTIHTRRGLQLHSRGWTQSKVSAGGEHQAVMRF